MSRGGATWHENALVPITRNGHREDVYWTYSYSPIDDETAHNGVGGVLVVCTETTATVLAGSRLKAEQEKLLRLLRQMPGFVARLQGPEHVYEYVNDAYVAISGQRDFVGHTVREVFPEIAGQGFYELLDEVYATGKPFVAHAVPIRLTDESEDRFIDLLYEPIRDADGSTTGIFVGGYDVSEAQRALAALVAVRIELLITDVGLPGGMNGRQIADAARVSRPDLKVLFITGYAENAVVGNGHLERGMAVLTKPFVMATLGNRIRELIAR
jgi:PAS domain-containing protein